LIALLMPAGFTALSIIHSLPASFFFQAEDGIRDFHVTGVQTCALPISAYVVVDSIHKEAEVFMAEDQNSIILKQMSAQNYSNGNFNLTKEDHCWTLSLNDTKLYQEPIM